MAMNSAARPGARRCLLCIGVGLFGGVAATGALAQAVEQHPAPVLHGAQTAAITASALESRLTDATPFGVNLSGLMLVDSHAYGVKARSKTGSGIDTSLAGATAKRPELRAILQKYLGQPLSYAVIGAIETEITRFYRENGRSLVLVTVPPQEVTSGVLQVNINTFVLETTTVEGAKSGAEGYVTGQIRVKPGQEVDTARLLEDVNWLNLNPFRHVSVVFEPGKAADSTRLTLQVQNGRPWSAYAGVSNSGTADTGRGRVFAGFNMSALPWQDHQLSYQFNGAPEGIAQGNLWDTGHDKGYLSHALSYFVPITTPSGFRMKLTLGASHVSSFGVGGPLDVLTTTNGLTGEMAFPLPQRSGTWSMVPELYMGWVADYYDRSQYLPGSATASFFEHSKLNHIELGLRSSLNGKLFGKPTHGDFDLSLTSGHRDTDNDGGASASDYVYGKASIRQEIMLDTNHSLALRLGGQYSGDALHALEQFSLGGDTTVRGYPQAVAASQTAAAFSVEYRMAPISLPVGKATGKLRPHVFLDAGMADTVQLVDGGTTPAEHLAAIGFGGEFSVGENLIAKVDIANTLTAAGTTKAGTGSIAFQLTARF